jgi:hypothetical protein
MDRHTDMSQVCYGKQLHSPHLILSIHQDLKYISIAITSHSQIKRLLQAIYIFAFLVQHEQLKTQLQVTAYQLEVVTDVK